METCNKRVFLSGLNNINCHAKIQTLYFCTSYCYTLFLLAEFYDGDARLAMLI